MAPYKKGQKVYTKKVTVHGVSKWVRAKTRSEVDLKAKQAKKELQDLYELNQQLSKRITVEKMAEEWIEYMTEEKKKWGKKHLRDQKSLIRNWVVPDPGLGAADAEAYHREKHLRTSQRGLDEEGKPKKKTEESENQVKPRRRKIDEQLEVDREERLKKAEPRPTLKGLYADQVTKDDLDKIIDGMAAGGYKKSSVRQVRGILKALFGYAKAKKYILENPAAEKLVLPGGLESGTHRTLTPAELQAALDVAKTHRGGIFILLLLFCGLRPQEAAALTWDDVDLVKRQVNVRKALKDYKDIGKTKTVAGVRQVPIPGYLYDALQKIEPKSGYVWTNTSGEPATTTNLSRMWNSFKNAMHTQVGATKFKGQIIESAVGDDLTMYDFRHTYATLIAKRAGIDSAMLKELMGHEDVKTTQNIYAAHSDPEALQQATDQINTMFDGMMQSVHPKSENPTQG